MLEPDIERVSEINSILQENSPEGLVVPEHTATEHFYRHVPSGQKFASVTTRTGILDAPHLKKWAARLAVDLLVENTNAIVRDGEISPDMQKAAVMAHNDMFEEAGDIGTRGHEVVERYLLKWMETGRQPRNILNFVDDEDSRVHAIARSAELFCNDFMVAPIASEMKVCSLRHKFAGTLDSLMLVSKILKHGDGTCTKQASFIEGESAHHWLRASTRTKNTYICANCGMKIRKDFCIVDWKTSNSIDKDEYAMQVAAYYQGLYEMTGLKPKDLLIVKLDKKLLRFLNSNLTQIGKLAVRLFKQDIPDGCCSVLSMNIFK